MLQVGGLVHRGSEEHFINRGFWPSTPLCMILLRELPLRAVQARNSSASSALLILGIQFKALTMCNNKV